MFDDFGLFSVNQMINILPHLSAIILISFNTICVIVPLCMNNLFINIVTETFICIMKCS